jgi:predicted nucleotidyltransferase
MVFDTSLLEKITEEKARKREEKRIRLLSETIVKLKTFFEGKRVRHVYLTGSILRERNFYDFSDIDVAVEGLEEDYFRTLVEIEDLLDRDVDLIELERCRFKEFIKADGLRVI